MPLSFCQSSPAHPPSFFFFFNDTATTEIYTLSLHDALPICPPRFFACPCFPPFLGISRTDRKSTRLNSSHLVISYAVFCLKKKRLAAAGDGARGHLILRS